MGIGHQQREQHYWPETFAYVSCTDSTCDGPHGICLLTHEPRVPLVVLYREVEEILLESLHRTRLGLDR